MSNLLYLGSVGAVSIFVSIFWDDLMYGASSLWWRFRAMGYVRWVIFSIGVACLICVVVGLFSVVRSTPDGEETVIEVPVPLPDATSLTLADKLRADWDAYGPANWPVAEVMAEASRSAYLPPYEAEKEFVELGFDSVQTMSDGSMIGYVVGVKDVAVVVFRGTDDPGDWLANLNRFVAKTPDGPAHRGFYTAYMPLSYQAVVLVRATEAKSAWVTGHSLGGALALLCAYELSRDETIRVAGLMTFGQPMVARPPLTDRIEELLRSRYVHFANNRDIVPRVPPSFDHCGSLVYYDGDKIRRSKPKLLIAATPQDAVDETGDRSFEIDPLTENEFASLQQELRADQAEPDFAEDGTPLLKGNSPLIRDHDMELYLDRVRTKQAAEKSGQIPEQ